MKRMYDQMMTAVQEGQAVTYLDSDEAFLATLYEASGNPVLVKSIQTLWERCRSYKLVGARAVLQAENRKPLWDFQARLLKAARAKDPDEAARLNDESLRTATARIHDELAAEIALSGQPAVS
jgi:DNA-binding GntR family transcriptional regulator